MNIHCCEDIQCINLTKEMNLQCATCNKKFAAECLKNITEFSFLLQMSGLLKNDKIDSSVCRWENIKKISVQNSIIAFNCTNCVKEISKYLVQINELKSQITISKLKQDALEKEILNQRDEIYSLKLNQISDSTESDDKFQTPTNDSVNPTKINTQKIFEPSNTDTDDRNIGK